MASKKIGNIVSVTGEYEYKGEDKKSYQRWGNMFQREDGSLFGKLQLPWGEFWFNVYPDEGREQGENRSRGRAQKAKPPAPQQDEFDDEIPF